MQLEICVNKISVDIIIRIWTCPPAVESPKELKRTLNQFNYFMVNYHVYPVKSSFDFKDMVSGAVDFDKRLLTIKK